MTCYLSSDFYKGNNEPCPLTSIQQHQCVKTHFFLYHEQVAESELSKSSPTIIEKNSRCFNSYY